MLKTRAGAVVLACAQDKKLTNPTAAGYAPLFRIKDSVVKIFTRQSYPDTHKPWTTQAPNDITGSGVVIEDSRIFTNAHMVLYSRQVQVEDEQSGDKVSTKVEAIDPGMDLPSYRLRT